MANVVVAWQSVLGGSATTAKFSVPPRLGVSARTAPLVASRHAAAMAVDASVGLISRSSRKSPSLWLVLVDSIGAEPQLASRDSAWQVFAVEKSAARGEETMAEQKRWKRRPDNSTWGDYGDDDQLGRMNELTPAKVKQGIAEVKEGKTFCLSMPLDYPGGNVLNP